METPNYLTIVSGLPRSGTSLMMQMLVAGGIEPMTDLVRAADDDNPHGYFELEAVKQIQRDRAWLANSKGKVVKMVHNLLAHLPLDRDYRVLFMQRELSEVLASQRKMLDRHDRPGAMLPEIQLKAIYEMQVRQTRLWLASQSLFRVLEVNYSELVQLPASGAERIKQFLNRDLNLSAMAAAVDPSLHRNRSNG